MSICYACVYTDINSFMGNPNPIANAKLKLLTVLHLRKGKQCLIRQVQSVHYSEKWSKFYKAAEYSKCHLLELLLGKRKVRWKRKFTCSEAKEFNHLMWHKIILIHCCGIFYLKR